MRTRLLELLSLCLVLVAVAVLRDNPWMGPSLHAAHRQRASAPPINARVVEAYGKLPLSFEANQGQTTSEVKFLSRGSGYSLFLTSTEAVLALNPSRDRKGAVPFPRLQHKTGSLVPRVAPLFPQRNLRNLWMILFLIRQGPKIDFSGPSFRCCLRPLRAL